MKIVVAYSGGLDTSVLLLWLKEKYNAEIIAYCADVGQGDQLDGLEAKALSTGASKCFIGDLKEDFAANYIFPMIQAGAIYEGRYLLGTSIARPCITADMIKIALAEGADAIAHGATGKGNDQVRFELSAAALAPNIKCIAPWRDAEFRKQFLLLRRKLLPGDQAKIEHLLELLEPLHRIAFGRRHMRRRSLRNHLSGAHRRTGPGLRSPF